jgi:hypothetical protein
MTFILQNLVREEFFSNSQPCNGSCTIAPTVPAGMTTSGTYPVFIVWAFSGGCNWVYSLELVVNQPPVAKCKAGPLFVAVNEFFEIDDGSFDPDGDAIRKGDVASYAGAGIFATPLIVTNQYFSNQCL